MPKLTIYARLVSSLIILIFAFPRFITIKANDEACKVKNSSFQVHLESFDSLVVSWDPNPEPDMLHYELYRAINNLNNFELISLISHPTSSYIDANNISPGNIYAYTLIAVDTAGNKSENSDTVSILITHINDHAVKDKISEYILYQNYPNPFNLETNFLFTLSRTDIVTIKIFNLSGQLLESETKLCHSGNFQYKFIADRYSSGIYFYQISTISGFKETRKMLLQK